MSPNSNYYILKTFDTYAKSQRIFADDFAKQAAKPAYVKCLRDSRAVEIVQPLLDNIDPKVRLNAVLGLARLAGNSVSCAKQILCANNLLKGLLGQIANENTCFKKNCMKLIRNLSKHLSSCSEIIVNQCDGIHAILTCMKDLDELVREVALQAISSIAGQDVSISQLIISSGIMPQIVRSLKEERHNLKLYALTTLSEIAKHNQKFAKKIVDMHTLPHVIIFLSIDYTTDVKLQASALLLLRNIAKHSLSLTEKVVESNLFPEILLLMGHPNEPIRYNSSQVVHEVVKHSIQISNMIVTTGGIVSLLNVILNSNQYPSTPAILALGYISSMSPLLAMAVIKSKEKYLIRYSKYICSMVLKYAAFKMLFNISLSNIENNFSQATWVARRVDTNWVTIRKGHLENRFNRRVLKHLTAVLKIDTDDKYIKASTAWTLEMIGQHSAKHSKCVFASNAVNSMIEVYSNTSAAHEAHHKCKSAIQIILSKCEDFATLEKLLTPSTPIKIMLHVLLRISKMLPKSHKARRIFIQNGHLKMIQDLNPDVNTYWNQVIKTVNCCFPDSVIQMIAGEIPESVLKKVDTYVPKSQCLLYEHDIKMNSSSTNNS